MNFGKNLTTLTKLMMQTAFHPEQVQFFVSSVMIVPRKIIGVVTYKTKNCWLFEESNEQKKFKYFSIFYECCDMRQKI